MHRSIALLALTIGIVATAAPRGRGALTVAVVTEVTDAGRQVPPATADHPVYVTTHPGGRHDFGRRVAGQDEVPEATLQQQLDATLAADHYLAATEDHPPSLLLIFTWGLHANLDPDLEDPGYTNLLDRAALVGGKKFADDMLSALRQENLAAAATSNQPYGAQLPGMNPTTASAVFHGISPLETFRKRDLLTRRLLDQIANDCYYVVVSALDYDALVKGQRRLLWRTKLSANAQGSSLAGTIPVLVRAGAGRFGRDMSGPELVSQPAD